MNAVFISRVRAGLSPKITFSTFVCVFVCPHLSCAPKHHYVTMPL